MKKSILFILSIFMIQTSWATHNRAGEITYTVTGEHIIECTVTTYTKTSSIPADRDSIYVCWGDSQCDYFQRSNGDGEPLENDYKKNIYIRSHAYSDYGTYTISFQDPNRNANILNINSGASDDVAFYVETMAEISPTANNAPVLLQEPIDLAYLGQPFIHVLNAFDLDGDSISYHLITPLMDIGTPVPNFQTLEQIMPGANNTVNFDSSSGTLVWDAPQIAGEYNIAFEIVSYRNGIMNGKIIRDMQILVLPDDNMRTALDVAGFQNGEFRQIALGDTISLEITASDSDAGQQVTLSSSSPLYDFFNESAEFIVNGNGTTSPSATFEWVVKEEHLNYPPLQIVFKAKDNLGLANFFWINFGTQDFTNSNIEIQAYPNINIFPNPGSEYFYLKNIDHLNENIKYDIFTLKGELLQTGIVEQKNGIPIFNLPNGIFILRIKDKFIQKIIIQH